MFEYVLDYEIHSDGIILYGMYHPFHFFDGSTRRCPLFPMPVSVVDGCLTLPSSYQGHLVVGIADFWMMGGNPYQLGEADVRQIIIPETYKRLGDKNFSGWKHLESVTLYCNESAMGEYNFAYCDRLGKVECMNPSIYSLCKSLPFKSFRAGYGCFDGCLGQIDFVGV